jgi:hypothetical protein
MFTHEGLAALDPRRPRRDNGGHHFAGRHRFPGNVIGNPLSKSRLPAPVDAIADGTDIEAAQDIADSLIADILELTATA